MPCEWRAPLQGPDSRSKQKVTSHASSQGLHSSDNLLVNENGEFVVNRILQHCASLQLVIF